MEKPRILLVDDNPDDASFNILQRVLPKVARVVTASSAEEAVRVKKKGRG